MLLEVMDAILAKPVLPAADKPADQVFGILRHLCDIGRKLEPLLF